MSGGIGGTPLERVAVITSGGGGGEPQFAGTAGEGMADAACIGNFRSAPNAYALYEAGMLLGKKRGVLFVYNNFAGDVLNNDMAAELLALEGVDSASVMATDDIASARGEAKDRRGGLCGVLLLIRVAAAASRLGFSLEECRRITEKANARLRSITIVEDDAAGGVMLGSGFSGEPPLLRVADRDAGRVVETVCDVLAREVAPAPTERVHIMVNRLSATTYMEGFAFAHMVRDWFQARGFAIGRVHVGNYFSPVTEQGYYLSVLSADDELEKCLSGTVSTESFSL